MPWIAVLLATLAGFRRGCEVGDLLRAMIGLSFVLPSLATSWLFEGKPFAVTAINGGYHVVRFALMELVIGLMAYCHPRRS